MAEYPKDRAGKHFAHRLVRLMARTCAAAEIGRDGFCLVTIIAHTEDAKRYTAAVTNWNEQLMPLLDFTWDQLNRARKKAIAAGWLHYEPGGKGRVGKYWTLIPKAFEGIPDGPIDCEMSEGLFRTGTDINGQLSSVPVRNQTWEKLGESLEPNLRETWEKLGRTFDLPTLVLTSDQINDQNPPIVASATKPPRGRKVSDRLYSEDFLQFWEAYPPKRKTKKPEAWEEWQSAIKRNNPETLKPWDPKSIIAAAVEFSASPVGLGRWCPEPGHWLKKDRWCDSRESWQQQEESQSGKRNPEPGPGQKYDPNVRLGDP